MVVPWNSEHDSPVTGVRHHDGAISRNKRPIEYQMDSLAGSNYRFHRRVCLASKVVAERARRIDHHFAPGAKLRARFRIVSDHAVDEILRILREGGDRRVVQ